MKKQHWYSLTFCYGEDHTQTWASVYLGLDRKAVSVPTIEDAKTAAKIGKNAVLLSCCYLGKMTRDEVQGEPLKPCLFNFWGLL